ncbi:MAG: hypothetical protein P1V97_06835 [Planctomycetota bacterium]|nr:hypothetical protein [Planctomycetota bacterium]
MKVAKDCAERLWRFARGQEFSAEMDGFEIVSAYSNILQLIDPEASMDLCRPLEASFIQEIEWASWSAMTKERMAVGRSLSSAEHSLYSYETCLNLQPGALESLLSTHHAQRGRRLSLLELGAGLGIGFRELCDLPMIDKPLSRALTLPFLHCDQETLKTKSFSKLTMDDIYWDWEDPRQIVGSFMHLRPQRRVDCVLSVWSLSEYHPLGPVFGMLQGMTGLELGGLLITDLGPRKPELLELFLERGVLQELNDSLGEAHFAELPVGVQILARRPSIEECVALLKLTSLAPYF